MREFQCPHCHEAIPKSLLAKYFGSLGGKVKSKRKAAAAREAGKLGGRPKKGEKP